ncbi:MAG: fumarylacetoacetate hydrolase family protein [Pseudomonadota bacterium]
MAWLSFSKDGHIYSGWCEGEEVAVLGSDPIETWLTDEDRTREAAQTAPRLPLSQLDLIQPVPRPGKILALALNYHAHAAETGREPPKVQKWFVKQATAANGPYSDVELPAVSDKLDHEAELVVVIGKYARNLPAERAFECIAGVCCGCDYSVRDWQKASPTMIMGKGFDTHAPFGPWITPLGDVKGLEALEVRCLINDEQRQSGHIGDMVFSIREQIAHLTAAFTLEPGDLIFTGTPAGVGVAADPPRFLKTGDTVRVEIDQLGHIENTIIPGLSETYVGQTPAN